MYVFPLQPWPQGRQVTADVMGRGAGETAMHGQTKWFVVLCLVRTDCDQSSDCGQKHLAFHI